MSLPNDFNQKAKQLRLMAFDVDGVMTTGSLYYGPDGELFKTFNSLDGHGLKALAGSGVTLAIITGRNSPMVAKRAADLGIEHVIQGREDKGKALASLAASLNVTLNQCAYMGDDQPDVSALTEVALAFSVVNGHQSARAVADYVTQSRGGEGAVREVCDLLLVAREGI